MKRPQSGKRTTLRTIAEDTGFAVATVSRALADDPKIAAKTRQAVSAAAKRLNYVPDRAAQRLRTGRTKVIGVLLNLEHEFLGFTDELLGGISEAMAGTGFSLNVIPDSVGPDRIETVRRIVDNRQADGLILSRIEPFDDRVRLLSESGFPFVTHGRTEFTTPHAWVDFDNEAFARRAVDHLVGKGCRHLMMIAPDPRFTFTQHLRYGFMNAVRDHGVDFHIPEDITLATPSAEMADYIKGQLSRPDRPDGHVCVGEVVALATLSTLLDLGLTLGDHVSVFAKEASPIFRHVRPQIETVSEDLRETGRHLGRLLLEQIAGTPGGQLHALMQPSATFDMSD